MKRVDLPTANVSGQPASPQIKRTDFQRMGLFARENLGHLIRDLVPKPSTEYIVMGGEYALAAGLSIDVYAPLAVYRQVDGVTFELYSDTPVTLTLDAADANNPRVDLIVAELHESSPQNSGLRHFRQDPPTPGQPEGDVNVSDELWDYVTVAVVKGTASATPVPPVTPGGAVVLYTITLAANATGLEATLIADGRPQVASQEEQDEEIAALEQQVGQIRDQFSLPLGADEVLILSGAGKYSGWRAQQAFADLAALSDDVSFDPLTRPETLTQSGKLGALPNLEGGTLPVVDIPLGLKVAFSNAIRSITQNNLPASLAPRIINLSGSSGTDTDSKDTAPLTVGSLLSIESDGLGSFISKNALCPSRRIDPACAARDGRYIEVFGGRTETGSILSDWFTYDSVGDVVIPRSLTGAPTVSQFYAVPVVPPAGEVKGTVYDQTVYGNPLAGVTVELFNINTSATVNQTTNASGKYDFTGLPAGFYILTAQKTDYVQANIEINTGAFGVGYDIAMGLEASLPIPAGKPAMFSCGNNRDVLLAVIDATSGNPRWFLVNTQDYSVVEKFGGPALTPDLSPQPYQQFLGDLVQPGIIVILALGSWPNSSAGAEVRTFWAYDVNAGTFTQLTVSGAVPQAGGVVPGNVPSDACLYQSGQLVLFLSGPGPQTFVFDYPTRSWSLLGIGQPHDFQAGSIAYFRMINIGGTPVLFAGTNDDGQFLAGYWSLTPGTNPAWSSFIPSGLPRLWSPGGASLISNGLPRGGGYCIAGLDPSTYKGTNRIYVFSQGGVIETQLNGVTGLTLAPGSRQAVIRLQDYQVNLSGVVSTVFLSLAGSVPPGSVTVSMSLDDGAHWQTIPRDKINAVVNSSNPARRQLKITMFAQGTVAPIITGVHEVFEKTGGPALSQAYIRITVPAGTRGLYIKRDGSMEVLSAVNPTVPDEAILLKMIHNGSGIQPSVKNYVNQRRLLVEYSGAKGGGNPQFDYDGAVAPTFIRATGVTGGSAGAVYRVAKPTIVFDGTVTVTGLSGSSDNYFIEAEA